MSSSSSSSRESRSTDDLVRVVDNASSTSSRDAANAVIRASRSVTDGLAAVGIDIVHGVSDNRANYRHGLNPLHSIFADRAV